jgi:hypothetical protein
MEVKNAPGIAFGVDEDPIKCVVPDMFFLSRH